MPKQPDATLKFADAEAELFLHVKRLRDGERNLDCDQMIVRPFNGKEDNVIVCMREGERTICRTRQEPGAAASANFTEAVEEIPPGEKKRLLAIYDRLLTGVAA